jgi:hypothetical protein
LVSLAQQDGHDEFHAHHMLGIIIGHTVTNERVETGKKKWLVFIELNSRDKNIE